jgi:hypothetical protein
LCHIVKNGTETKQSLDIPYSYFSKKYIKLCKKVLNTKPEGARKVGRPRVRWEECVWQDIRILGVKNWRSVALNGEEWRAILRKARAHKGLSRQ